MHLAKLACPRHPLARTTPFHAPDTHYALSYLPQKPKPSSRSNPPPNPQTPTQQEGWLAPLLSLWPAWPPPPTPWRWWPPARDWWCSLTGERRGSTEREAMVERNGVGTISSWSRALGRDLVVMCVLCLASAIREPCWINLFVAVTRRPSLTRTHDFFCWGCRCPPPGALRLEPERG